VRQAVAYALDYDGMTKALGYEPIRQPAVASASVYDKALNTKYTYDPAKAKALLAEAGYKDGLDVGEMLFTVSGTIPKLAQVAQESLKAVGITVKLRQLDGAAQVAQLCGTGQAECKMLAFSVITWDPLYIAETFLLPPKGGANLGGEAATGDLAKKLALAQQPASQQEHDTYLKDLIATMSAETINVFTGLVPTYAIYRSDVRNVASGWFIEGHPNHGLLGVVKK
jgi:peptide/nickel transport system substrate-binding protein